MARILSNRKLTDTVSGLAVVCMMAGLILCPGESLQAAREGLTLCYNVILPSLFPFFVLSSLLLEFGLATYFGRALEGLMRPLFRVGGVCSTAFALGFIGGYPVGAKTAISLYQKKLCSKEEAERLLGFCNNSGPAFMLGWAGLSVHCQVLSFIGHSGLSVRTYLLGKFLHGGISAFLIVLITRFFPFDEPVAAYLAEQVADIAGMDFQSALVLSLIIACTIWVLFLVVSACILRKNSRKRKKSMLSYRYGQL